MATNDLPTFQTVRLARGRHAHARAGVCVVELASMLAGDRFSDRPRCACPIVSAFLRGYNDGLDDRRRQDLIPFASDLVGSRSSASVTAERLRRVDAFGQRVRPFAWLSPGRGYAERFIRCEAIGLRMARRAQRRAGVHAATLEFVASLLAISETEPDRGGDPVPGHRPAPGEAAPAIVG